jgi:uncharacterized OsmC-like protein
MAAAKASIDLGEVTTTVRLKREGEGPLTFECSLSFAGEASAEQRRTIADAVANCPVRRSLSRGIEFRFDGE